MPVGADEPARRPTPAAPPSLLPPPAVLPASDAEEPSPRRPAIYLASDPLGSLPALSALPPAAEPAQIASASEAAPAPALASSTVAPAWRQAAIPEGSNRTPVGRMPPPAAMPGFLIGAGDTVVITVLGRPELSASGNVSGDGLVTAALIGAVPVLGLSPQQAAQRIAQAYKDGQYLVDPQVTVTLSDYQSQQLSVLGEVKAPGRFAMRTRLSILDALALAGGISDSGAQLAYILRPEDSVVTRYEIDLDALLQAGAGQQYFELLAGDTVVVPKAELFYIYGEVKSPNAYKLKPGLTVIQALSLAGGLSDKGSDRRIDLRRQGEDGRLQTQAATLSDTLLPNDVIYVRERLF
jgi:polysaccharide export outer membrane protein